MHTKTLLSTVKRILSDLNYEQVNSIYDTEDAMAVARIVVGVHSAILTEYPWVIKDTLIKPLRIDLTTISVPESAQRVRKVRYHKTGKCLKKRKPVEEKKEDHFGGYSDRCDDTCNIVKHNACRVNMEYFKTEPFGCKEPEGDCLELTYLELEDFLKKCSVEKCEEDCHKDTIVYMDHCCRLVVELPDWDEVPNAPRRYTIDIENNKDPEYWTVINGDVVLDSFCYRDGTRILERNLQIIGQSVNELSLQNDAKIDLPLEFYNYLVAEALSTAYYNLEGRANEKEESRSQRLRRRLLREHGLQGAKRTTIDTSAGAFWRK